MMSSVFAKIKAEKLAQKLSAATGIQLTDEIDNPIVAALLNDFRTDLQKQHSLESKSAKAEFKASRLDHYRDWVNGILANEAMPYDKITTEMAVWSIDAGDLDYAIQIADYMLNGDHPMPPVFEEKTASALLRLFNQQADIATFEQLKSIENIFLAQDVKDDLRAKLYRKIGEHLVESDPKEALHYWDNALELDKEVGVKTKTDQLRKKVEEPVIEEQSEDG